MRELRCCMLQLRRWRSSGRMWTLLAIVLVFTYSMTRQIIRCARDFSMVVSPWLYPHLFRDRYMILCYMLCVLLLFCDAPFVDAHQFHVISRVGRRTWAKGMVVYICLASAVFFLSVGGLCALALLPVTQWSFSWGHLLEALSEANPYTGQISSYILSHYSPAEATGITLLLTWQVGILIGLLLYWCNLKWNRSVGILAVGAVCILDFFLYVMLADPVWIFYLSPVSWVNLEAVGCPGFPTVPYAILGLVVINGILSLACVGRGSAYEPVIQEEN